MKCFPWLVVGDIPLPIVVMWVCILYKLVLLEVGLPLVILLQISLKLEGSDVLLMNQLHGLCTLCCVG